MIASHTEVEVRKGGLIVFSAHKEHNFSVFPLLQLNVKVASPLEHKLVLDLLLRQVGDSDGLQVVLEGLVVLSLLVVGVTYLYVPFQPRILQLEHLLKGWDGCRYIAHLNAYLCNAAKIVEVLLVLNS